MREREPPRLLDTHRAPSPGEAELSRCRFCNRWSMRAVPVSPDVEVEFINAGHCLAVSTRASAGGRTILSAANSVAQRGLPDRHGSGSDICSSIQYRRTVHEADAMGLNSRR